MSLAACLRWERVSKMASSTTTHRHDYRWPKADCLIPRAEAPNGHCEAGAMRQASLAEKAWCGRDPPALSAARPAQSVVCRDLVPTPVERPWCRRGPLVTAIRTPNQPLSHAQMRLDDCQPKPPTQPGPGGRIVIMNEGPSTGLQHPQTSKPWCNNESSNRVDSEPKRRPQPEGCHELAKLNFSRGDCAQGMVAARVGAAPQQDGSRYDQPDQYLRKLCDKHPRPMAVVAATPRDELMRRVYADRYRTTYQSDFCKNADDTARLVGKCDTYDPDSKLPTFRTLEGRAESQPSAGYATCVCGCGCRVAVSTTGASAGDAPRIRPIACRPAVVSDNVHFSCCTPKRKIGAGSQKEEEVGPPQKIPPWASEYTDGIGRTGNMILEQKLLHHKKKK